MFQLLFKYPLTTFARGQFVLLGSSPAWLLAALIAVVSIGLAIWIRVRFLSASGVRNWHAGVIWLLESLLASLLLLLLWHPAIAVSELKPQENIVAVVVDDSRSMSISEDGSTREEKAIKALQAGVLQGLQKKYQVNLYRLGGRADKIGNLDELHAAASSTRISDGLKQLASDTANLPIGAMLLLSDGDDNSGGIDADTISTLRNRRIPVHTVGLGREQIPDDVEIDDAVAPAWTLADSRLSAAVSFHQRGFSGRKATLAVRDGGKVLASREITLATDGKIQTESLLFNAGPAGVKALQFSIDPLPGEENRLNNAVTRLISVNSDKRRILYVEGEPRWEYKFIRRAEDDERIVHIATMLRTTENKIYRQGIDNPKELADGFPAKAEDLFAYQGLIIGSVEAGYFTPGQQDLIRQFVDRRGGGVLFLGGRYGLSDGGWGTTPVVDMLPVTLPDGRNAYHRETATVELTPSGTDSLTTRLTDDPARNAERWKKLPYIMDYEDPGSPKPGAAVLAEMNVGMRHLPLLTTQNFGRGRTAVLATGGTWRWQMSMPLGDTSHTMFWQQLLRWLVTDTPGNVVASVPSTMLFDDGHVQITADVRDKQYMPAPDAGVEAHIIGPDGISAQLDMTPVPGTPGMFRADWSADKPGSYLTEVTAKRGSEEIGRGVLTFQRMDGVAENFHTAQNRDLLEKLASQTGGQYWRPEELAKLDDQIALSDAGITVRRTMDLWDMPAIFLLIVLLRAGEWLLRRQWGIV